MNIATSRRWRNKDSGETQEETEWHRVVVWGPSAENCAKYLEKGAKVYVEGRLRTYKYQAEDGSDRYSTEIVAETVQFLDSRRSGSSDVTAKGQNDSAPQGGQGQGEWVKSPGSKSQDMGFDDVPF